MKLAAALAVAALLCSCGRHQNMMRQPSVWDVQVKNAFKAGDGDEILRALRTQILENPTDNTARRRLADRYLSAGYRDLAIEHLRLALAATPSDESLCLDIARLLAAESLPAEADRVLSGFARQFRPSASLLSYAAIVKDEMSDFAAGEALHRQALAKDKANLRLKNNLAFNLSQNGKAEEAAALFREILRDQPTFEAARNNLAYLYATILNQPEEALLHWKAASGPANAHNNLAAAYMDTGKFAEARAELEKALILRFQFPEAQKNLQILAARTGGTVELKLERDKQDRGLSKLSRAFRHIFIAEEDVKGSRKR